MRTKITALAVSVGVLAATALIGGSLKANDVQLLGHVAGPPAYEWNQPFLDWPQTGDLPCQSEEGPCGPPAATLDPTLKAEGRPLRIAALDVPVGDPGRHELDLGQLVFPNGFHSRTSFSIANGDPKVYRVAQTHVEFRSLEPGAPPFTQFARDRAAFKGPELVMAVLVWDVDWASAGATMKITDLVVE